MKAAAVDAAITDRLIAFYEALLSRGQIAPATQEERLSTAPNIAALRGVRAGEPRQKVPLDA